MEVRDREMERLAGALTRLRTQLGAELAKARLADASASKRTDLPDLRVSPHNGIAAGLEIALFLVGHHLREAGELSDPVQCSGEEGFCPEHGFHRHLPTRLEARQKTIREHTLNLHVIGEQLSEIESWFWAHLADVREAARQELGGPLPDDALPARSQTAPSGPEGAPDGPGGSGQPAGRPRAAQVDAGAGDGPSAREAAADDRRWFDGEKGGE